MAGYPIVRSVDFDKPQGTPQARKKPRGEQYERSHAVFSSNKSSDCCFRQHLVERDGQVGIDVKIREHRAEQMKRKLPPHGGSF
ncbi:hypothetical protein EOS_12725 [Caballeronia mineralivorans PML1(12)]|uniref:Uncharacterized protein n=1 Tax=Caballeronia mineralivorans PML1(12) TaxID=908627 RepID=A0A0J1G0P0_9BURK|nr:hypothetical protein [Caballeronia mineralivorans]KLU25748.1 hypothetical protein EOS_12725 [Caballeronia mineralivorans PML1(12)]